MSLVRGAVALLVVSLAVVLQVSLFPYFAWDGIVPNLSLLVVVPWREPETFVKRIIARPSAGSEWVAARECGPVTRLRAAGTMRQLPLAPQGAAETARYGPPPGVVGCRYDPITAGRRRVSTGLAM